MTLIHPLRCTAHEFASSLEKICGRGYAQAVALYQCFIREGKIRDDLPEFRNAPLLYQQMVQAMDLQVDPLTSVYPEDNATKFLMTTHDGCSIESVIMAMHSRKSLCVSSQIGCRMACAFCKTGHKGLVRDLAPEEIVQQLFAARHVLQTSVQNVVFMGMGEPFENYERVLRAVAVMSDPLGFGIGLRRITISTSGDIPAIVRFAEEIGPLPNLAVSLGGPTDTIRSTLMPRRRKESIKELYEAMKFYCHKRQRQILLSYVLLNGVNDSVECADQLAEYLKGLDVRVNVIPYNSFPDSLFSRPSSQTITSFLSRLRSHCLPVFLRQERGSSIQAACGQLG